MRRETIFCDRCKKVIPEGLPDLSVALQNPAMSERFDLCFDCITPIRDYLEGGKPDEKNKNNETNGSVSDTKEQKFP